MGMGGAMSIVGAIASIVGDIKGAKEQARIADIMRNLPGYQAVDPTKVQADTVKGNIANFNDASTLASATNQFNSDQILKMQRALIPGFDTMLNQSSQLVQDRLAGKIGQDASNQIWSSSAGRALGLGIAGSGAGRNVTARDLGLASYNVQNSGFDMGQSLMKSARSNLFDVSSMFLTPQQRLSAAFTNNENLYNSAMQQALGKTTGGADAYYAKAFVKYGNAMMGMGGMGIGGSPGGAPTTGGGGGGVAGGGVGNPPGDGSGLNTPPGGWSGISTWGG